MHIYATNWTRENSQFSLHLFYKYFLTNNSNEEKYPFIVQFYLLESFAFANVKVVTHAVPKVMLRRVEIFRHF